MGKKLSFFPLLTVFLMGCSAALVPSTKDPSEKVSYAYQLIQLGRPIPAEKLAKEAAEQYESQGDFGGAAQAYTALGVLYSSQAYRSFETFFRERGDYDPTSAMSITFHRRAMESHRKAGDLWGVANSWVGVGDGYANQGDMVKACDAYAQGLAAFHDPNAKVTKYVYTWNPKYPSYDAMLKALVESSCGPKKGANH